MEPMIKYLRRVASGVTLARRFNAGERVVSCSRRVVTTDFPNILELFSAVATRRECFLDPTRR